MKQTVWEEFVNPLRPKTLNEARADLHKRLDGGLHCPCCGQFAKIYKRKILAVDARQLIYLYQASKGTDEFFHIKVLKECIAKSSGNFSMAGGGDFAKLRYWGLIEEKINEDTRRRCSGFWRITEDGIRFVENRHYIKKYACVYDDNILSFEGRQISIIDALGQHFDYNELMAGI